MNKSLAVVGVLLIVFASATAGVTLALLSDEESVSIGFSANVSAPDIVVFGNGPDDPISSAAFGFTTDATAASVGQEPLLASDENASSQNSTLADNETAVEPTSAPDEPPVDGNGTADPTEPGTDPVDGNTSNDDVALDGNETVPDEGAAEKSGTATSEPSSEGDSDPAASEPTEQPDADGSNDEDANDGDPAEPTDSDGTDTESSPELTADTDEPASPDAESDPGSDPEETTDPDQPVAPSDESDDVDDASTGDEATATAGPV